MPVRALPVFQISSRFRRASRLGRFRAADRGVAAVEFALILPVMITLLLGMSEITHAVNVDRKLTLLSRSLADLSSRDDKLNEEELKKIFAAASVIMQPYDASKVQMVISSMEVSMPSPNTYTARARWSCARGQGAEAKPTNVTYTDVPLGFRNATGTTAATMSYHMQVDVKLPYTPMFGKAIAGTINLAENTPWPIRAKGAVDLDPNVCPPLIPPS